MSNPMSLAKCTLPSLFSLFEKSKNKCRILYQKVTPLLITIFTIKEQILLYQCNPLILSRNHVTKGAPLSMKQEAADNTQQLTYKSSTLNPTTLFSNVETEHPRTYKANITIKWKDSQHEQKKERAIKQSKTGEWKLKAISKNYK